MQGIESITGGVRSLRQMRMRTRLRLRAASIVCLSALIAAACKSAPPAPPPTIVRISVSALDRVNPDHMGRPSPVLVRVYELKTTAAFDSADFFTLYGKDQATLGGDLNAKNEFLLKPGDSRMVEQPAQPGTKFVAVVAAYRDIERSRWRSTVPVPPNQTTLIDVRIDAADVSIDTKRAPPPKAARE